MLRFNVYRPLAKIHDHEVCIVTKHERNFKQVNASNPLNSQDPIACRITVDATATHRQRLVLAPRTLKSQTVRRFDYNQLTEVCLSFTDQLKPGEQISSYGSLQSECTSWEAGPRVFPGAFALRSKPVAIPSAKKG